MIEGRGATFRWLCRDHDRCRCDYFGPLAKVFGRRAIILDQSKAVRNDPENYAEVLAHPPKHGGALKSQRSFPGIFPQKNALNAQNALHKNDPQSCKAAKA